MGTGTKIAIVAVIAGATIGIIVAVAVHRFDNSFKAPLWYETSRRFPIHTLTPSGSTVVAFLVE
jgi:hypothetical protein